MAAQTKFNLQALKLVESLISAKQAELQALTTLKELAEREITRQLGGDPDKNYIILPDGRLVENERQE